MSNENESSDEEDFDSDVPRVPPLDIHLFPIKRPIDEIAVSRESKRKSRERQAKVKKMCQELFESLQKATTSQACSTNLSTIPQECLVPSTSTNIETPNVLSSKKPVRDIENNYQENLDKGTESEQELHKPVSKDLCPQTDIVTRKKKKKKKKRAASVKVGCQENSSELRESPKEDSVSKHTNSEEENEIDSLSSPVRKIVLYKKHLHESFPHLKPKYPIKTDKLNTKVSTGRMHLGAAAKTVFTHKDSNQDTVNNGSVKNKSILITNQKASIPTQPVPTAINPMSFGTSENPLSLDPRLFAANNKQSMAVTNLELYMKTLNSSIVDKTEASFKKPPPPASDPIKTGTKKYIVSRIVPTDSSKKPMLHIKPVASSDLPVGIKRLEIFTPTLTQDAEKKGIKLKVIRPSQQIPVPASAQNANPLVGAISDIIFPAIRDLGIEVPANPSACAAASANPAARATEIQKVIRPSLITVPASAQNSNPFAGTTSDIIFPSIRDLGIEVIAYPAASAAASAYPAASAAASAYPAASAAASTCPATRAAASACPATRAAASACPAASAAASASPAARAAASASPTVLRSRKRKSKKSKK